MKNACGLPVLLVLVSLASGCDNGNKACDNTINAIQPNTNPPGYEVLLKTTGFSPAAKVVFGTVEAVSHAGGESDDIIARVPAGLSGNVEISMEEGDCIARSGGFVVAGSLPSGVQPSLPDIIVPVPATPPTGPIGNIWRNAVDKDGVIGIGIVFQGDLVAGNNPVTNAFEQPNGYPVTGNINTTTNIINISVDRTADQGILEHFDGKFSAIPSSLTAYTDLPIMVLVSRETGRQLILFLNK